MVFKSRREGFTLTEVLVVLGIIIVVVALLLPALAGVRSTGHMTKSTSNLRQIATWMRIYQDDSRDHIVPSQFDYTDDVAFSYKGKVRSETPQVGNVHQGTWTDILWTQYEVGVYPPAVDSLGHDYRFDSPDPQLYEALGGLENPFRSAASNSVNSSIGGSGVMRPYGCGAEDRGEPGYFAANDFFNARPDAPDDPDTAQAPPASGRWYTAGQMKAPDKSVYVVDSFAGEVINDPRMTYGSCDAAAWEEDLEVDFRYAGNCLMLFLDGHVNPEGPWTVLEDLDARNIRVTDLTGR